MWRRLFSFYRPALGHRGVGLDVAGIPVFDAMVDLGPDIAIEVD